MAVPRGATSRPDNKPLRQRHSGHDRKSIDGSRRRELCNRRSKSREQTSQSSTHSPQWTSQFPSPVGSPSPSIPTLLPVEPLRGFAMERTPSGNSIVLDDTIGPLQNNTFKLCSDDEAAQRVISHMSRKTSHVKHERHERILRRLIENREPISRHDVEALDSALTAADVLFFDSQLKGRVIWDWSDPEEPRYRTELIGTTALRQAKKGGYETLIVLSDPILTNPDYDRRLLLSAFLHELIHSYLFIACGFDPSAKTGHAHHTQGFHQIAAVIDDWVGPDCLRLCNMKANLNHFRRDSSFSPRKPGRDMPTWHAQQGRESWSQSPRPYEEQHLQEMLYIGPSDYHDGRRAMGSRSAGEHQLQKIVLIRSADLQQY